MLGLHVCIRSPTNIPSRNGHCDQYTVLELLERSCNGNAFCFTIAVLDFLAGCSQCNNNCHCFIVRASVSEYDCPKYPKEITS